MAIEGQNRPNLDEPVPRAAEDGSHCRSGRINPTGNYLYTNYWRVSDCNRLIIKTNLANGRTAHFDLDTNSPGQGQDEVRHTLVPLRDRQYVP